MNKDFLIKVLIIIVVAVCFAGFLYGISKLVTSNIKQERPCSELGYYQSWQLPVRCREYWNVK